MIKKKTVSSLDVFRLVSTAKSVDVYLHLYAKP